MMGAAPGVPKLMRNALQKKKKKNTEVLLLCPITVLCQTTSMEEGGGGRTKGKQKTKRKTEVEETCMENSSAFRETCGVHEGSSERR